MTKRISLPSPFDSTCFLSQRVFSESDCKDLINRIQNPRLIEFDSKKTPQLGEGVLRIVERTGLNDSTLASWLYERIAPVCPPVWEVQEEDEHTGAFAQGKWELDSIDPDIQLYRYTPGGTFSKHRDGAIVHSADKRSFFTALVYLNEEFKGGNTTVYTDDLTQHYKIPYSTGACFVMLQRTLHEGEKVEEGLKYAMRCDIMYRRASGNIAEEALQHLDKKSQARKWFDLASSLELSGFINESIPYYQKAYRLDPNLEV